MKIKIIKIVEILEEDKENLLAYGFSDGEKCIIKFDSKIMVYDSFDKMVQEQTNDFANIRVLYEEREMGEKMRSKGWTVDMNELRENKKKFYREYIHSGKGEDNKSY